MIDSTPVISRNSFMTNLFGTIAGGLPFGAAGMDFIPAGNDAEKIDTKALWLGLKSPFVQRATYDFCYPVSCIIDRISELDLNGCVEILRTEGKGKNDLATNAWAQSMNTLFVKPNSRQSFPIFRKEQTVFKKVFGYCLVFAPVPVGYQTPAAMMNLKPWRIQVRPEYKSLFDLLEEPNDVIYYSHENGITYELKISDLLMLSDSAMQDEITHLPQSKLVGLDMAISNLCAAMEADNVLLRKKGPLGFISNDPGAKDSMAGYLPMAKAMKNTLQRDLGKYGLSLQQWQYVITRAAAKWNPMSFDIKQLGTKETVVASEKAICHRYGFPYVLYEMTDTTFANAEEAHEIVYEDVVMPDAQKDYAAYGTKFGAEENKCTIVSSFDHIGCLQADKKEMGEARLALNNAYEKEWLNDLITRNMWLTALGYDTIEGGDVYYSQWIKQNQNGNTQENTTA